MSPALWQSGSFSAGTVLPSPLPGSTVQRWGGLRVYQQHKLQKQQQQQQQLEPQFPCLLAAGASAVVFLGRRRCRLRLGASKTGKDFNYGEADYWDQRYRADEGTTYDWLGDYEKFKEFIEVATRGNRAAKVLDLGCGNATLVEQMYDDGYRNITAIDLSAVAIDAMRKRNAEKRPEIQWLVANALELEFDDAAFDLVIDKSTMDAIACEKDVNKSLVQLTAEASRVLRFGGTYLVFSSTNSGDNLSKYPHLSFDTVKTEIPLPFAQLAAYAAVKSDRPAERQVHEMIAAAEQMDEQNRLLRQKREEAERRLHEAPTSFGILD
mmetsp:Transcript_113214/g.219297  ORF Transcript_113214/g.219297 Transcript_113214/m.219297 type:complete len:323 (+) Transcript_113214:51-1019(+)